ncbi:unnamed protein product [Nesidiocoris tenuis]|uniref:Uncharacterized protein n=1 Tax=Nesidiocoris tenuis TaxID=355587 RepID=A0A6H5GHL7_9HEMI|nr:unnamed protein product [Nesidiocoris tenuis]
MILQFNLFTHHPPGLEKHQDDTSDEVLMYPSVSLEQFQEFIQRHPDEAQAFRREIIFKLRKIKETESKQQQAYEKRLQLLQCKTAKVRGFVQKVEDVKVAQNKLAMERKHQIDEKLRKAEENRKNYLSIIRRKAHDEEEKLKEIAFINELEAQNRRHDSLALRQEELLRVDSESTEDVHREKLKSLKKKRCRKLRSRMTTRALEYLKDFLIGEPQTFWYSDILRVVKRETSFCNATDSLRSITILKDRFTRMIKNEVYAPPIRPTAYCPSTIGYSPIHLLLRSDLQGLPFSNTVCLLIQQCNKQSDCGKRTQLLYLEEVAPLSFPDNLILIENTLWCRASRCVGFIGYIVGCRIQICKNVYRRSLLGRNTRRSHETSQGCWNQNRFEETGYETRVSQNFASNKMDDSNLSIIFTPTIMPISSNKLTSQGGAMINQRMKIVQPMNDNGLDDMLFLPVDPPTAMDSLFNPPIQESRSFMDLQMTGEFDGRKRQVPIRSPSARKIGSFRNKRRITRHSSLKTTSSYAPRQGYSTDVHSSLRRGRPNTLFSGLPQPCNPLYASDSHLPSSPRQRLSECKSAKNRVPLENIENNFPKGPAARLRDEVAMGESRRSSINYIRQRQAGMVLQRAKLFGDVKHGPTAEHDSRRNTGCVVTPPPKRICSPRTNPRERSAVIGSMSNYRSPRVYRTSPGIMSKTVMPRQEPFQVDRQPPILLTIPDNDIHHLHGTSWCHQSAYCNASQLHPQPQGGATGFAFWSVRGFKNVCRAIQPSCCYSNLHVCMRLESETNGTKKMQNLKRVREHLNRAYLVPGKMVLSADFHPTHAGEGRKSTNPTLPVMGQTRAPAAGIRRYSQFQTQAVCSWNLCCSYRSVRSRRIRLVSDDSLSLDAVQRSTRTATGERCRLFRGSKM